MTHAPPCVIIIEREREGGGQCVQEYTRDLQASSSSSSSSVGGERWDEREAGHSKQTLYTKNQYYYYNYVYTTRERERERERESAGTYICSHIYALYITIYIKLLDRRTVLRTPHVHIICSVRGWCGRAVRVDERRRGIMINVFITMLHTSIHIYIHISRHICMCSVLAHYSWIT